MKPRCKRCHRVLHDPVSIAIGMGPECRGDSGHSTRSPQVHQKSSRGSAYSGAASPAETRAAALASGQPVETGLRNPRTLTEVVYVPDENGNYVDRSSGHTCTPAELEKCLEACGLIHKTSLPTES